jgi:hypothetical protein
LHLGVVLRYLAWRVLFSGNSIHLQHSTPQIVITMFAEDPLAGAAGTRFGRNVPLAATQPDTANLLHPNPLLVSAKLLQRKSQTDYPRVPFLNLWAGAWVQFQVHDW